MIKQVRFSKAIGFFFNDFCQRWDLEAIKNQNKPAFFAGVYDQDDIKAINEHKGFKVIWHTGRMRPAMNYIRNENCVVVVNRGIEIKYPEGFKLKRTAFELKDYSPFTPHPAGEKVYCYLGNKRTAKDYGYDALQLIKEAIPYEVIEAYHGHQMSEVMEWYKDSFVNLKFRMIGGFGTSVELAKMGRPTIGNTNLPYCRPWDTVDGITTLIHQIYENRPPQPKDLTKGVFTTGKEWKELEFWQKDLEIS